MTLRRTPIDRPAGAELVRLIAAETSELPPTRREPDAELPKSALPLAPLQSMSTATEQINFRGSPGLARLLARLAAEQGSIRLVIARLLSAAGYDIPEADMAPPPGRRRL